MCACSPLTECMDVHETEGQKRTIGLKGLGCWYNVIEAPVSTAGATHVAPDKMAFLILKRTRYAVLVKEAVFIKWRAAYIRQQCDHCLRLSTI